MMLRREVETSLFFRVADPDIQKEGVKTTHPRQGYHCKEYPTPFPLNRILGDTCLFSFFSSSS